MNFASIVENSIDGIFVIDMEHTLYANRAIAEMMGVTVDEFMASSPFQFTHASQKNRLFEIMRGEGDTKSLTRYETVMTHSDGHLIPVESSVSRDIWEGKPVLEIIVRDISKRKEAEEAVVRAERLAAVGTLAAGIAHEYNNIHTGLLGFLELILEQNTEMPMRLRVGLETVYRSAQRAVSLTRKLFSFAKPRSGDKTKAERIEVNEVIRDVVDLVRSEWEAEGINIRLNLMGAGVVMCPGELSHIIMNLIINARHALSRSDRKMVSIDMRTDSQNVIIKVSDTGCGIPYEDLHQIFTPFYSTKGEHRMDSDSPLADFKGTGLGLSVCDMIARSVGGSINVESEPNEGAVFTVRLPLARKEERPIVEEKPVLKASCGRILVIDDEESVLSLFRNALDNSGIEVDVFDEPFAAWDALRNGEYDIAFVDMKMPFVDGEEFIRKMHEVCDTVPVIITGSLDHVSKHRVLYKPFGFTKVVKIVNEILWEI